MPPSCPLCEAPLPAEVVAGPPEAVFSCPGCYLSLTWKNGAALPTPRASAPGAPPPRPSSPIYSPLAGLPPAPRTSTGPIPRARASAPMSAAAPWEDATRTDRPAPMAPFPRSRSTEQPAAAPEWNDATNVEPAGAGPIPTAQMFTPESTLVEVPAIGGPAPSPVRPLPSWLEETSTRPLAAEPLPFDVPPSAPQRIPAGTQALYAPFSLPQPPGALPELPRTPRANTGAFPAAKPSIPGRAGPATPARGTSGAFPAAAPGAARAATGAFPAAKPATDLKPLPRGTTGQFAAVGASASLPPLPRAPTGAFAAVRPSAPTMPVTAVPRPAVAAAEETPRASAPTTPYLPASSPPETVRVPSYGDLAAADTAARPVAPAFVLAPGTVDTPELGAADTVMSPALSDVRPSAPLRGGVLGRIALTHMPAPEPEPTQATSPSLAPIDDAPATETREAMPVVELPPVAQTHADLPPVRPEAVTQREPGTPPEPTPPPPHLVTAVRSTPPVAPARRGAAMGQGKLIALFAIPVGLVVLGGGGWLLWSRFSQPSVVEIPLPPEPAPRSKVVAPPEPPPPPPEPVKPPPVEPEKPARTIGGKPVVLESDEPPNATVAKARDAYRKGKERMAAKDKKGALAAYRASLKLYPGYVASYRGLGQALAASGDKKGAVKMLKVYVEKAPEAADAEAMKKLIDKLGKKKK